MKTNGEFCEMNIDYQNFFEQYTYFKYICLQFIKVYNKHLHLEYINFKQNGISIKCYNIGKVSPLYDGEFLFLPIDRLSDYDNYAKELFLKDKKEKKNKMLWEQQKRMKQEINQQYEKIKKLNQK